MKLFSTLRARLMLSFTAAALVPLVVATLLAVPWYRDSVENQAARTLDTHATVQRELFDERVRSRQDQVTTIARTFSTAATGTQTSLSKLLQTQAGVLDLSYLMWVDEGGVVQGSTTGQLGHKLLWPELERAAKGQRPISFVGIVPVTELVALDKASDLELKVKATEGGSAPQSEASGAISIVAVSPVRDADGKRVGAIVGVETLKLDNSFVDSVVAKLGGVATVFQNGVRVATTVTDEAGNRAIGTAVSDKVRAASLDTGRPFRGEAFVVNKPYFAAYEPLKNSNDEVVGMLFVGLDQAPYRAEQRNFALGMGAVMLLGVAMAVGFGALASKYLSLPIQRVSDAAAQVATGDLTVTVPENESFREARTMGRAFNTMTRTLRTVLGQVNTSAQRLDSVSGEIAQSADLEAESASSQASSVAEATATIEELDRSFAAVADGARRVLEIAEDSLEVADSGRDAVEAGTVHVERLANGASAALTAAGSLAEVADDIGQVTFVIGSIAEQTKILALNAAIEAARAGEAGKGFGVVATEIRSLAESVSTSVGRIEALIRAIQDASKELAATAERQAELGATTVDETSRTRDKFDEIYDRMERTASAAREIATAASQQQSAGRQIVQVMQQVSQGVSGTAAAARQLADASGDVKSEAKQLSGGLQGFKVD